MIETMIKVVNKSNSKNGRSKNNKDDGKNNNQTKKEVQKIRNCKL